MKARISAFAAIAAASFLASCGGGDGDNGASTRTYELHAAWVNYVTDSGTKAFTLTGMSPAIAVGTEFTGSGTATFGQLDSATFESQPALTKAIAATGLIYATGHTVPYDSRSRLYFDSNYLPVGAVSTGAYTVVTSAATIPQTAKVDDTGPVYTGTTYADSTKTTIVSTSRGTYAVVADTASTALFIITDTESHPDGWEMSTYKVTFRMTLNGDLTRLTEEYGDWVSWLRLTY
jgi:hypothetical protein